ncbi:MAG: hypothetical protein SGPRY_004890 [Prymnesium sp.]
MVLKEDRLELAAKAEKAVEAQEEAVQVQEKKFVDVAGMAMVGMMAAWERVVVVMESGKRQWPQSQAHQLSAEETDRIRLALTQ